MEGPSPPTLKPARTASHPFLPSPHLSTALPHPVPYIWGYLSQVRPSYQVTLGHNSLHAGIFLVIKPFSKPGKPRNGNIPTKVAFENLKYVS